MSVIFLKQLPEDRMTRECSQAIQNINSNRYVFQEEICEYWVLGMLLLISKKDYVLTEEAYCFLTARR